MKKIVFKIFIYLFILIFGVILILAGVGWYMEKQELVVAGHAKPNFPYSRYTQEELNKMYPQYPLEDVKTTQTPEETYAKFIAALKKGDVEEASKQFVIKKQNEWLESLRKIKEKELLAEFIKDYDKKMEKIYLGDSLGQYRIGIKALSGQMTERPIGFVKSLDGVWKIESL